MSRGTIDDLLGVSQQAQVADAVEEEEEPASSRRRITPAEFLEQRAAEFGMNADGTVSDDCVVYVPAQRPPSVIPQDPVPAPAVAPATASVSFSVSSRPAGQVYFSRKRSLSDTNLACPSPPPPVSSRAAAQVQVSQEDTPSTSASSTASVFASVSLRAEAQGRMSRENSPFVPNSASTPLHQSESSPPPSYNSV